MSELARESLSWIRDPRRRSDRAYWQGGWHGSKPCQQKVNITLEVNEDITEALTDLANIDLLDIVLKKHSKKRSLDANALMWVCLQQIADKLGKTDRWSVYLEMLRKYGQFTYIVSKPSAVEAVKKQWREAEEFGTITINGEEAVQLRCYFGTSTYDSKEFSTFLEHIKDEMEDIGLQPPASEQMRKALELWEKQHQ